jgi:3-hydroxyacyl-CoA dehydrogenase/3-hydroxy-2-methylbutyryl-CoA dehydrogenase
MKIEGNTFIVSGGSSGLGLATVEDLLSANANIVILDRQPPQSSEAQLNSRHIKYIETDISSLDSITKSVQASVSWAQSLNPPSLIRGVINCAGIGTAVKFIDRDGNAHDPDIWDFVIKVNLSGTFHLTRLVVEHMVRNVPPIGEDEERGVIIMVSSAAAYEGQPGQTAYSATKGAVRSMTLPMSRDLGRHGVRVVTIAPGVFESAMTRAMNEKTRKSLQGDGIVYPRRFGKVEEFAKTVRWVVDCAYVNGETIRLSGAGRLPGKL